MPRAVAIAGLAGVAMLAAPQAATADTTPIAGVGVGYGYIGDIPNAFSQSYGTAGNKPLFPGQSATWQVTYVNVGNVPENLAVSQTAASFPGGTPIPSGWVTFTPVSAGPLDPGWSVVVAVTVTVPATAAPGLYTGILLGIATGTQATSGNLQLATGAGHR